MQNQKTPALAFENVNTKNQMSPRLLPVRNLHRKTRFRLGFLFVVLVYAIPIIGFASGGQLWYLAFVLIGFAFSMYFLYSITIKKNARAKLGYPIVNPEGQADVYTGRMPRPIYEDMQRYPWFFGKKRRKKIDRNRYKKKK